MRTISQGRRVVVRLWGSLRRNGFANVVRFGADMVQRRGLSGTLNYALATALGGHGTNIDVRELDDPTERAWRQQVGERALDKRYAVDAEAWRRRQTTRQHRQLSTEDGEKGLFRSFRLSIILRVASDKSAADVDKTLKSITGCANVDALLPLRVLLIGININTVTALSGIEFTNTLEELNADPDAWLLYLSAGDRLEHNFLDAVGAALCETANEVLSFDLTYERDGLVFPILLPGANPVHARRLDYMFSRIALRARLSHTLTPSNGEEPYYLLTQWLQGRSSPDARAAWTHLFDTVVAADLQSFELGMKPSPLPKTSVQKRPRGEISVVICTKDMGHLLRQLVRTLLSTQDELIREIVIISNNTSNLHAIRTLRDLELAEKVCVIQDHGAFNFSRLSNRGARMARGRWLLFLNDDIVPVTEDWLAILLGAFDAEPATGIAGPLLLYPDERVQHAGVYLGFKGSAGHTLRGARLPQEEYLHYASAAREVSAVTGAVMLVSRACFDALNGFDEMLGTYLQDVDLSLRALHAGFANIFEPEAILIHMESPSIRPALQEMSRTRARELTYFQDRWRDANILDHFHNPAFDPNDERLRTLSAE